jgi:hypothetical protein
MFGKTEMEHLDARIKTYYDSLPKSDIKEESAWGAVSEAALAPEEDA